MGRQIVELFNHVFVDGTSLIVLDKKLGIAEKEVLTIQFNFMRGGQRKSIEAALYDMDRQKDLGVILYKALQERYGTVETLSDTTSVVKKYNVKTCAECGKEFTPTSPAMKKCLNCKGDK